MGVQPDTWIAEMARTRRMIEPFVDTQVRTGISYGLSSYGYDFRIADEFRVPVAGGAVLDPKAVGPEAFREVRTSVLELPAGGYAIGRTVEYFRIPREVVTIATGKSTYARCGVTIYVTPFEPEWEGYATIAIANSAGRSVRIYAGEGIGQLLFLRGDGVCAVSYADKQGKYQAQQGITHARGSG
ncbi:MAG: dCTP deaminase [Deltaproteobacteria bacterium]|nr:dCTP deaminase [Deltaproteobacteria bacterium]